MATRTVQICIKGDASDYVAAIDRLTEKNDKFNESKMVANMLVDTRELSKALGVSQELLRKLAREKKIPFYRLSKRTLRFDPDEVYEFMKIGGHGMLVNGKPDESDGNASS